MARFKNEQGEELSLDDILQDSEYQAEFDRKIQKAMEKNKATQDAEMQKKLEEILAGREDEIRKNIQDEMDAKAKEEAELAKMSEAEKYKKQLDTVNQKLVDYENKLAVADREKKIKAYIKEKGYDMDAIMDFVNPESLTDNFQDRIDSINEKLQDRISKGVNERLKDEEDKILGNKGGGNNQPDFHFEFQSVKPETK